MKKETSLCMGCMTDKKDALGENTDVCSVCGYGESSVFLSSYLTPTTFLAERYIVGKLISYNGEGAYYIAFDTVSNIKVTIREYMPDTLCGRKKEEEAIEVNPQFVALYKTYLSEFIELNRSLMNMGQSLQTQRVLDVFSENNTAYAVYEYITGISLKSYLSNLGGVLPWEQVKELFTPLFTTLNLVHQAGIIHRGINPSTILFNDKNELVLINFGITAVRTYGSEINHEVFAGYAGPEQYSGAARHGSWTDVYGVAAVLYKVLTGQLPQNALSRQKDADSVSGDSLTEPALINRNIPQSVSAAIMNALTLDVDKRTQSVNSLIRGLFETVPVSVPDSTSEILIKKPPRKQADESFHGSGSRSTQRRKTEQKSGVPVLPIAGLAAFVAVVIIIMVIMFNPGLVDTGNDDPNGDNNGRGPAAIDNNPPDTPSQPNNNNNEENQQPADPPSNNEPLYVVPNLTGRRFESITFEFLVLNPVYEFSYEHDEGFIFEQDIEEGTDVTAGTEITLTVSMGPATVELPFFAGRLLEDYERVLNEMKIKYVTRGEYTDSALEGFVFRCSINGNEVVAGDMVSIKDSDLVVVYFSLGIDPATLIEDDPNGIDDPDPYDPDDPYNNDD
jgi:serine/threonine-protein kinase